MKAWTGYGALSSRYAVLWLALAALAAAMCFAAPSVVHAQEQERPGLLNRLFGFKPAYRIEDRPAEIARPRAGRNRAERTRKKKARAQRDVAEPPPVAVVTKRPEARPILVIGDFLGSGLAEGLTTAFSENADFRVVDRTSGSSGFVREDFYNWPEEIDGLITSVRPAAIVVMIGANDRQQMLIDGTQETVRSESWNKEYARRADALAKAISARKVPFLWVGMPPFKSSRMMLDMLAFNEFYRVAAAGAGGEFVDIWDGFVDENGAYVSNGPDLNGQPARLRANDGINLARPGKRKVAFYAEKPLYKLLGQDPSAPATALSARSPYRMMGPFGPEAIELPSDFDIVVNPNELVPLDASRPVFLRTPGLDGGEELLGMVAEPRHEARTPAEKLVIEGIAPAPVAGRADQFAAPQFASAATAMGTMDVEETLNKMAVPSVLPDPARDEAEPRAVRSDALSRPQPEAPLPAPPAIQPDRLEEVSPPQAAPDVAAATPPLVTPATLGKAIVHDAAKSYPLDLSPARGAPLQTYKRPKSIGGEPNRAPTAVPRPIEDVLPEEQPEIPSASNDGGSPDTAAETKPSMPDTAPARAPAPSIVPDLADDQAPARGAPGTATPVPVAALPSRDAPTELLPAAKAPQAPAVPAVPVEAEAGVSVAKAVPALVEPAGGAAPAAKSAPSALAEPAQAPVQRAPTALPAGTPPTLQSNPTDPSEPDAAAPAIQSAPGAVGTQPATPPAPAAPTVLPARPARKAALPGGPAPASVSPTPAVAQPISASGVGSINTAPSTLAGPGAGATPQP